MEFQKISLPPPPPKPIFTDAIQFATPVQPNPGMAWKFNDDLIIPLRAFDSNSDPRFFTQGIFFGVEDEHLIRARVPVQTNWGISQAIYLLDRSKVINITAYQRAGITLKVTSE